MPVAGTRLLSKRETLRWTLTLASVHLSTTTAISATSREEVPWTGDPIVLCWMCIHRRLNYVPYERTLICANISLQMLYCVLHFLFKFSLIIREFQIKYCMLSSAISFYTDNGFASELQVQESSAWGISEEGRGHQSQEKVSRKNSSKIDLPCKVRVQVVHIVKFIIYPLLVAGGGESEQIRTTWIGEKQVFISCVCQRLV